MTFFEYEVLFLSWLSMLHLSYRSGMSMFGVLFGDEAFSLYSYIEVSFC